MPKPRNTLISLDSTPYYHCVSRCVRRAFLCGFDRSTNKSYEHRRLWVENRILQLGQIFAIDVCGYAVMSNHHHVILRIDKKQEAAWSDAEICERWNRLYNLPLLAKRFSQNEPMTSVERDVVAALIDEWRSRLTDISWFMRCLNEPIARAANREDKCTGRFFEGRFKSQALLDEKALLACLAYVDLNPVRACIAKTPEQSEHTSVKKRVDAIKKESSKQPGTLLNFVGNPREPMPDGLPFHLHDYLELVDLTGRVIRDDKRGAISQLQSPILERLDIDAKHWLFLATKFESRFKYFVGATRSIQRYAERIGLKNDVSRFSIDLPAI